MSPSGLHVIRHHPDASGPPVVLVHGAPDRSKNLAHVVHRLGDLPVTVYDRRGYGRSVDAAWSTDGTFLGGFDIHATDLIELLDGTPSVVVGQSAGGSIAMLAATRAPELFRSLGLWEPPLVAWPFWAGTDGLPETARWAGFTDTRALGEAFHRAMFGDARWDGLRASTKELLRSEGAAFGADMGYQLEQFMDLGQIKPPTVVGRGTVAPDPAMLTSYDLLASHLGAELLVVEGADHFAHTNHPEAWVELVRRTVALA
jgi:pimeloyl-ACP methyl ester carboxylesterase